MKKLLIVSIISLCLHFGVKAQQWNGSTNANGLIYRDNNIYVGGGMFKTTAGALFGGTNTLYGTAYLGFNIGRDNSSTDAYPWSFTNDGANNGGSVIYGDVAGDLYFACKPTTGASSGTLSHDQIRSFTRMRMDHLGRVLIGSNVVHNNGYWGAPTGYNLIVEKGILTEKLKVAVYSSSQWSDYVFNKDFKLKSLSEVESYISKNKHLPDVPSAEDVVKDGIDVATMDARLLQKIEELTLYVIEQNKKIEALENKLKK